MSELTQCNYCNLETIKVGARKNKQHVTLMGSPKHKLGGVEVYVHPDHIDVGHLSQIDRKQINKYWVAWMWVIPDHCVC